MRTILSAAVLVGVCSVVAQAHDSHMQEPRPGHDTEYYAVIDDFHSVPSTTDATGEVFLTLNKERTQLAYKIVFSDLLGFKSNPADRTALDDVVGIHFHLHVPDAYGPHVLNIFGLATYNMPAQEDADAVIDYANRTITGIWDDGDATLDPATGQPYLPFFPLTSKPLSNWIETLNEGELMVAIHTNQSGFPVMAIHGHISRVTPEPATFVLAAGLFGTLVLFRRRRPAVCVLVLVGMCGLCGSANAQPATKGQWSAVFSWGQAGGLEAVHLFMLPTGKVMFWAYDQTSVGLWDPNTGQFAAAAQPSYNVFCSGHAWLADGRLLVAGGHITNENGVAYATIYNPFTNTWTGPQVTPDMPTIPSSAPAPFQNDRNQKGRWYPSATTLGNGDVLVMSGALAGNRSPDENPLPQVYQAATNTWRNLTSAYAQLPLYPRTFLLPDGRVASTNDFDGNTEIINPAGTGSWTTVTNMGDIDLTDYGSAVMYAPGKIVAFGGGGGEAGGPLPSNTIRKIDLTAASPTWTSGGTMAHRRRNHTATLLADGTVLVTGGSSSAGFNSMTGSVAEAELWDPNTGQITTMAPASSVYRGYHSTAVLMPDGRVLMAGGAHDVGAGGNLNAEIYSPPYLFKGERPTVTSAQASAQLGHSLFVATPDFESIADVTLITPGAVTHAQNWTQRINHLSFEQVPGGLAVTLPTNANDAPPGYYMLFLINGNGVPSIANWVRADVAGSGLPGDFNLDGNVDSRDYVLWRKKYGTPYTYGDYVDWRRHFGQSGSGGGSVPEPSAIQLVGCALFAIAASRAMARAPRR